MASQKPKFIFQVMLGFFLLAFTVTACNSSSENKESTDSTTVKQDTTATVPMDTTKKMMDTTNKMDTAKTRPVKEAN